MKLNNSISINDLRKLLRYDPSSGLLFWRINRGNAVLGAPAGWQKQNGYREVSVLGRHLQVHRVAWVIHHGEWPSDQIDHINLDPSDNRISNLRLATQAENNWNVGPRKTNKLSLKGVCRKNGKYMAQIQVRRKKIYLGFFDSPELAHDAYCRAAAKLHGEFMRADDD